jgi:hypothetical protein
VPVKSKIFKIAPWGEMKMVGGKWIFSSYGRPNTVSDVKFETPIY